jgi:hypothetical protein
MAGATTSGGGDAVVIIVSVITVFDRKESATNFLETKTIRRLRATIVFAVRCFC